MNERALLSSARSFTLAFVPGYLKLQKGSGDREIYEAFHF